ncbi:acyl-CoA N-acyltransferase [Collybia nuda]|uniref:Acyl-CoA N-acyltransferase n=1 Tax=Collybia nuda TaxID=64659 RepID=A0A9P5Y1M1_9AGAR|nr:acyl-CoA N-acyltransferase [Collybia nuda]
MESSTIATRRLVAIHNHTNAIGTRYQGATTHLPKYSALELSAPDDATKASRDIAIADLWAAIYALFTLYHSQEYVPLASIAATNEDELRRYLMITGLGRPCQREMGEVFAENIIFLSRATFWQGAGTTGYHNRGWLLSPAPVYPSTPSFTRSEMVIASHPLRPPKPLAGEILYRRYCAAVGQTLEIVAFDLYGPEGRNGVNNGISQHMAAFHKWHNDERVNSAWGERGSLETHREYIEGLLADSGVVPCMMSWDGELMGYVEIVWVKENHSGQYYPNDVIVGDWERGVHVLVGEDKFLGGGRSAIWLRSLVHYIFLADARTERVIGEPKETNVAMIKTAVNASFHVHTTIDFPYKRSVLLLNPRERFFKSDKLPFSETNA